MREWLNELIIFFIDIGHNLAESIPDSLLRVNYDFGGDYEKFNLEETNIAYRCTNSTDSLKEAGAYFYGHIFGLKFYVNMCVLVKLMWHRV